MYAREDDLLRESLLREGKALRELFRCPVVHSALPHPDTSENFRLLLRRNCDALVYVRWAEEAVVALSCADRRFRAEVRSFNKQATLPERRTTAERRGKGDAQQTSV